MTNPRKLTKRRGRPIWVEDEASLVGNLHVPPEVKSNSEILHPAHWTYTLQPQFSRTPRGRTYTRNPAPYTVYLHPESCSLQRSLHPTPCMMYLHPTSCNLHPTPCTLYPKPSTLDPTRRRWSGACTCPPRSILDPTSYTPHSVPTPHTLHSVPTPCTIHGVPTTYTLHSVPTP